MNPFTGSLNRLGFVLWNVVAILPLLIFSISLDSSRSNIGPYGLPISILFMIFLAAVVTLAVIKRNQNAGLNSWYVLLILIPYINALYWVILLFLPPKEKVPI